jgi:hypothetical protein
MNSIADPVDSVKLHDHEVYEVPRAGVLGAQDRALGLRHRRRLGPRRMSAVTTLDTGNA